MLEQRVQEWKESWTNAWVDGRRALPQSPNAGLKFEISV